MNDVTTRLADDVLALQSAAERLHEDTLERECAPLVPPSAASAARTIG